MFCIFGNFATELFDFNIILQFLLLQLVIGFEGNTVSLNQLVYVTTIRNKRRYPPGEESKIRIRESWHRKFIAIERASWMEHHGLGITDGTQYHSTNIAKNKYYNSVLSSNKYLPLAFKYLALSSLPALNLRRPEGSFRNLRWDHLKRTIHEMIDFRNAAHT